MRYTISYDEVSDTYTLIDLRAPIPGVQPIYTMGSPYVIYVQKINATLVKSYYGPTIREHVMPYMVVDMI